MCLGGPKVILYIQIDVIIDDGSFGAFGVS